VRTQFDLRQQCHDAAKQVRRLKRSSPYIFPQYSELEAARIDLRRARERLTEANEAWRKLGRGA
jgi:hypothetical protein